MKESDQLATSFITPFGMYCYITMPFGLRNAGATYQRCMQHVFGDHIGWTVEAYVDNIVVKTRKADDLVSDLRIAFGCLRANRVKLNPEKCVFGVPRGMLLGYIVSQQGIEANPEKVAALERMGSIRDLKGVQKVLGCLAALSRFISRLGEKGLPLYRLLKKHKRFSWTVEAQEALDKLKATLAHAPILTPPQDGEPLYLYVAATTKVVSAVIVVERTEEGHALSVQRPVYYISEVLSEMKARYPQVQKLLYAVVLVRCMYRWPNGPDTTGGTTHDTKKHDTTRTRTRLHSVSVDTTRWPCHVVFQNRHVVLTRTRHEKYPDTIKTRLI
jgi:hypothetical protein